MRMRVVFIWLQLHHCWRDQTSNTASSVGGELQVSISTLQPIRKLLQAWLGTVLLGSSRRLVDQWVKAAINSLASPYAILGRLVMESFGPSLLLVQHRGTTSQHQYFDSLVTSTSVDSHECTQLKLPHPYSALQGHWLLHQFHHTHCKFQPNFISPSPHILL